MSAKKWYKLKVWKNLRERQLARRPLCEWCRERGSLTTATEVHHETPHRGDWTLFTRGKLVSLCKSCHDRDAQSIERRGYDSRVGEDGWPADERHPANRPKKRGRS